jgi:hypothetical protein
MNAALLSRRPPGHCSESFVKNLLPSWRRGEDSCLALHEIENRSLGNINDYQTRPSKINLNP